MSGKFETPEDKYEYLERMGIIKKMPSKCPYYNGHCLYTWGDRHIDYCSNCPIFLQSTYEAKHDKIINKSTIKKGGDIHLDFDDVDLKVVHWLTEEFKNQYGIDLKENRMAFQRLTYAAKVARNKLFTATQTEINLPFLAFDTSGPIHFQIILTHTKLKQLSVERKGIKCPHTYGDCLLEWRDPSLDICDWWCPKFQESIYKRKDDNLDNSPRSI